MSEDFLAATRTLHEDADSRIRAVYEKRTGWAALQSAVDVKRRACFATVRDDAAANGALHRLHGRFQRARLPIGVEPAIAHFGPQAGNTLDDALLQLALLHAHWGREPEAWPIPDTREPRLQIAALTRHLLARYAVPGFLDTAWFEGFTESGARHRHWFAHVARGGSFRDVACPVPLTQRGVHVFLTTPPDWSIVGALRRGQVLGFGGPESLAQTLYGTRLGEVQSDEAFWAGVVHFLVNNPTVARSSIGPLLDFIHGRRFGSSGDDAPEPTFSMKGRTALALQRRVDDWHEQLGKDARRPRTHWAATGIAGLHRVEPDTLSKATLDWRMVELTDNMALLEEGRDMRHCVRSYMDGCVKGNISIWSLRLRSSDSPTTRRLFTVEVHNARRAIVQVRGRCNQLPSSYRGNTRMTMALHILRDWARERHVSISCNL
jgi:hypothetical protein